MNPNPASMTVFVTGASAGFGEACVRRFAQAGARVVALARRAERLATLKHELGERVHLAVADVRDRNAVQAAVAALPQAFARVDVLVNNAGLALGLDPAHKANLDQWQQMLDTNCAGLMYCTRALLPGMVERRRGHIINIGSVAGSYPYPGGNVYGATKAFVKQFSLNLRADLHGTGVRVTNLEPGLAETEFSIVRYSGDRERAAAVYKDAQALSAEDIAESVFWCATLPPHINVNSMEIMPTSQSFGGFPVHREAKTK